MDITRAEILQNLESAWHIVNAEIEKMIDAPDTPENDKVFHNAIYLRLGIKVSMQIVKNNLSTNEIQETIMSHLK